MAQRQVKVFLSRKKIQEAEEIDEDVMTREKYLVRESERESSDSEESECENDTTIKQLLAQAESLKKVQAQKQLNRQKAKEEERKKNQAEKDRLDNEQALAEKEKEEEMRIQARSINQKLTQEGLLEQPTCTNQHPKTIETYLKYLEQKTKLHREQSGLTIVNKACATQHLANLKLQEEKLKIEIAQMKTDNASNKRRSVTVTEKPNNKVIKRR